MSFWHNTPFTGQAPMDGVTDAAFRYITDRHGHPDLLFTEFVSADGLSRGAARLLGHFTKHESATPIVGQIYGTDLEAFRQSAVIVAELGFDGVDINMGCPDRAVASRGSGAGLIRTPTLAQQIIKAVRQSLEEYSAGADLDRFGIHENILALLPKKPVGERPKNIPVSVKTRIGYDKIVTADWIQSLLEADPVAITIHGRTLKQMYTGMANWEEIGHAKLLAAKSSTLILGNGDIQSLTEAKKKITDYGVDGVLIGRASFGNPWIFSDTDVDWRTRLRTALEHAEIFAEMTPTHNFHSIRKHLAWYTHGFANSAALRASLMTVKSPTDIRELIRPFLDSDLQ